MTLSSRHFRHPQGVPVVYVLAAVVAALLAGIYFGKSSAGPSGGLSAADGAGSRADQFDPSSGTLKQCTTENRKLIAALDRAGGDTRRFRSTWDDDGGDERRSDRSGAMGRRTSFGGDRSAKKEEPVRQTADIRAWSADVEKLANRPDWQASGRLNNRESVPVEGILHLSLVGSSGQVDEASLPMYLDPGLNSWEHLFRWVPDEGRYEVRAAWETLTF